MAIYKGRKGYRRRRPGMRKMKKGYRLRRQVKPGYKRVVAFKRTFSGGVLTQTAADQHFQYTFNLSNLPNYTELTNLYDQYKIKSVLFQLIPSVTSADTNPQASVVNMPSIHSVIDPTDGSPLTTLNDYLQYATYKRSNPLRVHKRLIYPKSQQSEMQSGGTIVIANPVSKWIRSENPNIDHQGLKLMIPAGVASSCTYQVFVTMYVLCKQIK